MTCKISQTPRESSVHKILKTTQMKKIFILLAMCYAQLCVGQIDTSVDISNAYLFAKNYKKIEREFTTRTDFTKSEIKLGLQCLAAIEWYANIQDVDGDQQDLLRNRLASYGILRRFYQNLDLKLANVDALLVEEEEGLRRMIQKLDGDEQKKIINLFKPLYKKIEEYRVYLNSLSQAKTLLDIAQKQYGLDTASRPNVTPGDSERVRLMQQIDSLTVQKTTFRNKVEVVEVEIDNLKRTVKEQLRNQREDYYIIIKKIPQANQDIEAWIKNTIHSETSSQTQAAVYFESKQETSSPSIQLPSFQLPSQAQMIDAMAIYLVKRVKQESVMWFFETIKKDAKKYSLIKTFFPNTITLLQGNEVYEIPNLGTQWRYALSKDFLTMPSNVFSSDWLQNLLLNNNNAKRHVDFIADAFKVCDLLSQQRSLDQVIKEIYIKNVEMKSDTGQRMSGVFSLLYALKQEAFVPLKPDSLGNKKSRWVSYEDLASLSRSELECFISLIDMRYGNVFEGLKGNPANSIFLETAASAESFRLWMGRVETGINLFRQMQVNYAKVKEGVAKDAVIDPTEMLFSMWDHVNKLLSTVVRVNPASNYDVLGKNVTEAFEIYNQLAHKNYACAVNSTIALVENIRYGSNVEKSKYDFNELRLLVKETGKISTKLLEEFREKHTSEQLTGAQVTSRENAENIRNKEKNSIYTAVVYEQDRMAINHIRKLAGFLNDVVLTTNSKQLAKVVASYAMPPGSYKRKRSAWYSLDFNAYVGAYIGKERVAGDTGKWSGVYGLTAPIGLTFSKTFGSKVCLENDTLTEDMIRNPDKLRIGHRNIFKRSGHTFSLMVTVVDLGAVVSYRFQNSYQEDKGLPQDVRWSQLLSPGIKLGWGIGGTPLILNAGYQYTPELRKLTDADPKAYSAHRWSVGVAFDLPLYNLYHKSHIKSKLSGK